jgi:ribosomal protein L40E
MAIDFEKIKATGLGYAEKGKNAVLDLTEKAKVEAKILNDQNKLAKAQRELGALVYSLAKSGEANQPLTDKYIDAIGSLEQEIEQLRASLNAAPSAAEETAAAPETEQHAGRVCPQCGAEVPEDALFCNKCGAQL